MLITADTRAALVDPGAFLLRRVDNVAVKGKAEAIGLYEVIDALAEPERSRRAATRDAFDVAQEAFERGDIGAALAGWEAIAAAQPDRDAGEDPALTLALERARDWQDATLPEDWQGVSRLSEK